MWANYLAGPYKATNPLKFTFLEDDQQALAKVAAGVHYDLIHPCIAYWPDWNKARADPAVRHLAAARPARHPRHDPEERPGRGRAQYHVPFDIGFSSLVYRADKVQPRSVLERDPRRPQYKGRIAMFSDGVSIIKIGALINAGAEGPERPDLGRDRRRPRRR